jgi:hypothetical protein
MKNVTNASKVRLIGTIVLAAAIAFTMAACGDGGGGGGGVKTLSKTSYTWNDGTNDYDLTITEKGRAGVTSGTYVLVIINGTTVKISEGTATETAGSIRLSNTGGTAFTITITDTEITVPAATIVTDSGNVAVTAHIKPVEKDESKTPSISGSNVNITDNVYYTTSTKPTDFSYYMDFDTGTCHLLSGVIQGSPSVKINNGKVTINIGAPKASEMIKISDYINAPGLKISDKSANTALVTFCTSDGNDWLNCVKGGDNRVDFFYVDKDVTVKGTYKETGSLWTEIWNFDLSLKKGWNFMVSSGSRNYSASTSTFNVTASTILPPGYLWVVSAVKLN